MIAAFNSPSELTSLSFKPSSFLIYSMDGISRMEIKTLRDKEQELIQEVLTKTDWNLEKASRLLQISLSQVKKKIREHGLRKPDEPA
jgi:transcriptional regulator with GAF, ATPase, and Fis domain